MIKISAVIGSMAWPGEWPGDDRRAGGRMARAEGEGDGRRSGAAMSSTVSVPPTTLLSITITVLLTCRQNY